MHQINVTRANVNDDTALQIRIANSRMREGKKEKKASQKSASQLVWLRSTCCNNSITDGDQRK